MSELNDKQFEATKRCILRLVDKWLKILRLDRTWRVLSYWERTRHVKDGNGNSVAGTCDANWQYMEAELHWSMPVLAGMTMREREETVVHELMHMVVNEMRNNSIEHEERVVTMLSIGMLCALDHGARQVKRKPRRKGK